MKKILALKKEISVVLEKYIDINYIELIENVKKKAVKFEYSKGGKMFVYGLYAIEQTVDKTVTNCTIGRKIKDPSKGYTYKYYFNEKGDLILIEKENYQTNLFIRDDNNSTTIVIDFSSSCGKNEWRLTHISLATFDERGKLVRYLTGNVDGRKEITGIKNIIHTYSEDVENVLHETYFTFIPKKWENSIREYVSENDTYKEIKHYERIINYDV